MPVLWAGYSLLSLGYGECFTDDSLVSLQVKGRQSGLFLNGIHSILLVLLAAITVVSSISAVRYIVVDSVNYNVFANLSV